MKILEEGININYITNNEAISIQNEPISISGSKLEIIGKRAIDIIGATIGAISLIPLTVGICTIKLIKNDKSPIFYTQKRIGKDGKIFTMYKYSSMVVDADKQLNKYLKEEKRKVRIVMSKKKRFILLFVLFAGLFCMYNVFWFISVQYKYKDYLEAVPEEMGVHVQFDERDNVTYNVKKPDYLSFTGNLGISDKEGLSLIIWPSLLKSDFAYGVRIQNDTRTHEIYINEKLEAITDYSEDRLIIEKYHNDIEKLFEKAEKKFKILK